MAFAFTGGNSSLGLPVNILDGTIVKEGWLNKRGVFMMNWTLRYFILMDNGSLTGFNNESDARLLSNPVHHFTITDCVAVPIWYPSRCCFLIKTVQANSRIRRLFCVETEKERVDWIFALKAVSATLTLKNVCLAMAPSENVCDRSLRRSMEDDKITIDNFKLLKRLGRGAFGKVVMCEERATKKIFTMKIMKKRLLIEQSNFQQVLSEHRVLKSTCHPFLTALGYSFQTDGHLCFVIEYVSGGDLLMHLEKEGTFSERRARFYAAEITLALSYVHSLGIIHRDLKLENVLLGSDGHVKITDVWLFKEEVYIQTTSTICGLPTYVTPELVELGDCGMTTDWWTLGVLVYEMVCGRTPFYGRPYEVVYWSKNESVEYPAFLSYPTVDFIRKLLVKDPKNRLGSGPDGTNQVMSHPFFNKIEWTDLLEKNVVPPFKPSLDTRYFDVQCLRKRSFSASASMKKRSQRIRI